MVQPPFGLSPYCVDARKQQNCFLFGDIQSVMSLPAAIFSVQDAGIRPNSLCCCLNRNSRGTAKKPALVQAAVQAANRRAGVDDSDDEAAEGVFAGEIRESQPQVIVADNVSPTTL